MIEKFDYDRAKYPTSRLADVFPFKLSRNLGHTWIIDVDGTIAEVNQYPYDNDKLLPGVKEMWEKIPSKDMVIIMTAREESVRDKTLAFIDSHGLPYERAIFGVHHGERSLVNDNKQDRLKTAIAWNVKRNKGY